MDYNWWWMPLHQFLIFLNFPFLRESDNHNHPLKLCNNFTKHTLSFSHHLKKVQCIGSVLNSNLR